MKKDTNTTKVVSRWKRFEQRRNLKFTSPMRDLDLHFLVWTWNKISKVMLAMNLEWCWKEKDFTNLNLLTTLSTYTLTWYIRTLYRWWNDGTICALLSFDFKAQCLRLYNCWTVNELSDLWKPTFHTAAQNSFHSNHIDWRDTSSENIPLLSACITRFVLMFRKVSDILFSPTRHCKMVSSRQIEILFYRNIGRQRFGAVAHVFWGPAVPF